MRWIKYTLLVLGGLAVLCLVSIGIALVTFDNDDYRRLVIRGVTNFTGYTMTIDGPFTLELSTAPTLSAEAIRFEPGPDEALPPFSEIGKFRIRIALWRLITGMLVIKELLAEDVVMAVIFEKEAEPENRSSSARNIPPDIEIPIVENVRLRNIHLDLIHQAADHTVEIRLRQFDLDDINDTGPLFVKGQGSVNGNGFKLDGELGALSALFKGAQSYPVSLNMSTTGFNLSASGTIEDLLEGEGVKLYLVGETGELSHLCQLLQMDVPRLGHLKLEANVINEGIMKSINRSVSKVFYVAIFSLTMALSATQVSAGERVQIVGTIKGAGCTHYQVECFNDDNHIALEDDFVLVMPNGEYYFMPNVYRSVKARHAYRIVRVHGDLRRQEVWVDKLVDLNRKKGGRAKTTWDWANDDFWKSK